MSNNESAPSDRSIFFKCRMGILHMTLSKGTYWKLRQLQHGISHHTWEQLHGLPVQRPTSQSLINRNEADTRYFTFSVLQICLFRKRTRKQPSLTVSWFFLKQLTCLASIGSLGQTRPQEVSSPTSWSRVSHCEARPSCSELHPVRSWKSPRTSSFSGDHLPKHICPNGGKAFVCNCSKPHLCCCNLHPLSITLLPRSALTSPAPSSP